jgi:hypothetical protein
MVQPDEGQGYVIVIVAVMALLGLLCLALTFGFQTARYGAITTGLAPSTEANMTLGEIAAAAVGRRDAAGAGVDAADAWTQLDAFVSRWQEIDVHVDEPGQFDLSTVLT